MCLIKVEADNSPQCCLSSQVLSRMIQKWVVWESCSIQCPEYRIQNTEYRNGLCVGKAENIMPPEPKTAISADMDKQRGKLK